MPAILVVLTAIGNFIVSAFTILVKNPFVQKMVLFAFFVSIVGTAIVYLVDLVRPYISNIPASCLASKMGIFEAISVYLSILIAGFGVRMVLGFIRS